jgi:hypothetical protein
MLDVQKDDLKRAGVSVDQSQLPEELGSDPIPVKDPNQKRAGTGVPVSASESDADFVEQPMGTKVYDKGEAVVDKMNRERAVFDKDLFFQELYDNYLVAVQRNDLRHLPSGVIVRWDMSTSFGDFMSDALHNIDEQLHNIKTAREQHTKKFKMLDDSVLSEMKIDSGSSVIGQQYNSEDYDATEELLHRSKETIKDYLAERISMAIDQKTGRVSIVSPLATK